MKIRIPILAAATLIPALLAFDRPGTSIEFAPEDGASLNKTFEQSWEMELDDMEVLMNGQDSGMMPEMEMAMTISQAVNVIDTYRGVDAGRPQQVTREYRSIGHEMDMEMAMDMMGETNEQSNNATGTSELEGTTVIFDWDGDEEEYTKEYHEDDEGADEDLLVNLEEDMDLRFLLPEDEVEVGDEWDIDVSQLPDLIAPGGDYSMDIEMEGMEGGMPGGPDPEMMSNMREMMGDMLEGDATARLQEASDGLATIELEISIDTARDMTDMVADMMAEMGGEAGMMPEIDRMDIEFTFDVKGKMLWDLRGNHIQSLDLDGDVSMTMDMEMSMDMGEAITIEVSMTMSGTFEESVSTE